MTEKDKLISVLMSVYNEEESYIVDAVESCLNQTYKDFELIIVNDNPGNDRILKLLGKISLMDDRIIVIHNQHNKGLALSLNAAAAVAKGDIYARMDADDVNDNMRFQTEYDLISSGKYDLITTNYHFIDENSKDIDENVVIYSGQAVEKLLPYGNTIHHPTVMMTREIFERAGGYRDFPCAQDYDLWLRMYDIGARMCMVQKDLFGYRVRRHSITSSNKMRQIATMQYIRKLYRQRKKYGKDSYCHGDYNDYLQKQGVNDKRKVETFKSLYTKGRKVKKLGLLQKILYVMEVAAKSPFLTKVYISKVRFVMMKKLYN